MWKNNRRNILQLIRFRGLGDCILEAERWAEVHQSAKIKKKGLRIIVPNKNSRKTIHFKIIKRVQESEEISEFRRPGWKWMSNIFGPSGHCNKNRSGLVVDITEWGQEHFRISVRKSLTRAVCWQEFGDIIHHDTGAMIRYFTKYWNIVSKDIYCHFSPKILIRKNSVCFMCILCLLFHSYFQWLG